MFRPIRPACLKTALIVFSALLAAPAAVRAQEPGIRHVVINELAAASQADHAIEIYNFGLDKPMNGWQLQYRTLAAAPVVTYSFPGVFVLPRHATVTVHYGPGTNTATDLFTGSTEAFSNSGGEVLLKDGTIGIDFMKFGAPLGTPIQPADLPWIGASVSWPTSTSGLARQHDVNTRSADDWNQPLPPGDGPTPGQLNSKQIGTRLYAPLLVNEFNRTNQQVEIYNPNNFTVNLSSLVLRGGQGGVDTQCGFVSLAGTLGAGARQTQTISGCGAWSTGAGTISIRDSATPANNWDFVSFNRGGGDLTMGGTTNIGYRKSDVPTASLSDWVVQSGSPTFGALNPGQQGALRYDELGAVTSPSTPYSGTANTGVGMQMDLTRAVSFREIRVRMTTAAAEARIALYRLSGLPNSWSRVGNSILLTPLAAGEQVYTTGPINVNFNSPDTILVMVFASGAFALQQAPPAERFSFGYVAGLNTHAAFPPPAGPIAMAGLDPTKAVQFYFWSQPGPAVTPEGAIKAGEVNLAYSQQFASSVGTPAFTWSANTLPPGLSFVPATQTMNGTPTTAGTFASVQVTSTDSVPMTDVNTYTLEIYNELLWNTLSPLPEGEVGVNYPLVPLSASGGPPGGYTWSVVAGALPAGLSLGPASGNLTGLVADPPVAAGSVTIRVQDLLGATKDRVFAITTHPRLTVSTASLPSAQQGVNYNQTLAYSGGKPGVVNWTIAFGALPTGITLTPATGQLSGIPTAAPGSYAFTAQVTDSLGGVSGRGLSIQVNGPLAITTASLPDGEATMAYNQLVLASGGDGAYSWTATAGLPAACSFGNFGNDGQLSCPNPVQESVSITVRVTDGTAAFVETTFNFLFRAKVSITTATMPDWEVGVAYPFAYAATDGFTPYTWAAVSGMPPGLTVMANGTITGAPSASGTFAAATVRVTDALGAIANKVFSLTIFPAVQIDTTSSLPQGEVNAGYSLTLAASQGQTPYGWSVIAGSPPPGVGLAAGGLLSGNPTTAGTFNFTVRVTDALGGNASRIFSLQIQPELAIQTIPGPPQGEQGIAYSHTFVANGGIPPLVWTAEAAMPAGLFLSGAGALTGTPTVSGNLSAFVRVTDALGVFKNFNFNVPIAPPVTIATVSPLIAAEEGVSYSLTLAAAGGVPAFSWSQVSGALPPGLGFSPATGEISGAPAAGSVGGYSIRFRVVDGLGGQFEKDFTLNVLTPVQITSVPPLPVGEALVPYSGFTFAASGGAAPYSWSLASGTLPPGLTLSTAGNLAGTPSTSCPAPTYQCVISIRVTDALGGIAATPFTLRIWPVPSILNTALPKGVVQIAYPTVNLIVEGGSLSYSYLITGGTLPAGITFNTTTGQFGGTPTAIESQSVTFQVTDSLGGQVSKALTIQVINPPLPDDWSRRAQFSGGVGQVVLTPGYSSPGNAVGFAAADGGGELFRTVDRGFNWQPLLVDRDNAGGQIQSIRLSPDFVYATAAGAMYVSTGATGVYRSLNGGTTFTKQISGLPFAGDFDGVQSSAIAIHPDYPATLKVWAVAYDAGRTRLYSSTRTGSTDPESWTEVGPLPNIAGTPGVIQLEASPRFALDNTLIAIYDGMLYRSSNAGGSWSMILDPGVAGGTKIRKFIFVPNQTGTPILFIERTDRIILRSVDLGTSYLGTPVMGNDLAWCGSGDAISVFVKMPGFAYGLAMSQDRGQTWVPVYARGMMPNGEVFGSSLAAGGAGSCDLYSGSQAGMTVSYDGGNIFFPRQAGMASIKAHSISGAGDFVIAATDGGYLRSRDGGQTFIQVQSITLSGGGTITQPNINYVAVSPNFAVDKTFFVNIVPNFGTSLSGLYRTTDGGFTFMYTTGITNVRTIVFAPNFGTTSNDVFAGGGGGLFKSTNAGVAFSNVGGASGMAGGCNISTRPETDGLGISPKLSGGYTLYRSGDSAICTSENGGSSWTQMGSFVGTISAPPTQSDSASFNDRLLIRTDFYDAAHRIMYSTNGGSSWSCVTVDGASCLIGILYARSYFSPNYGTDRTVLIAVNRSLVAPGGLYKFDADTGIALALPSGDPVRGRVITGVYMQPTFNGDNTTNSVALVTTLGGGLYRSTDGALSFTRVSSYDYASTKVRAMTRVEGGTAAFTSLAKSFVGPRAPSTVGAGTLFSVGDDGVFASDDGGITFDDISTGLPDNAVITAIAVPSQATSTALVAVQGAGLWKYDGTIWSVVTGYATGNYTNFNEDGAYLYAIRSDDASIRADLTGIGWTVLASGAAEDKDLQMASDESYEAVNGGDAGKMKMQGPQLPTSTTGTTAPLWSVSLSAGPRYSSNSGGSWTTSTGGNDYTLPGAASGSYKVVAALGLNAVSGTREAIVGYNGGLYKTTDGGDTWRSIAGTGSGLEATSKNFTAILKSSTAFSTTDILVGASGTATTGGVYLSGDGGEHWTQINAGFDAGNLAISSLVKTSCSGCPVQYYSGSYGSGVYTRTITVNSPPAITGWCFGAGCTSGSSCVSTAPGGDAQGGEAFKLCGTGFQTGAAIEFDKVPVYTTGCTYTSTTIFCPAGDTGTPAHAAAPTVAVTFRVRNPDTRAGIAAQSYTYTSTGTSRAGNSLTLAKSSSDAVLTWSCATCSTNVPARVYRSQSAVFSAYPETYDGGTGGTYTNTSALSSSYSYFWSVE